jgi:hypothetical protein
LLLLRRLHRILGRPSSALGVSGVCCADGCIRRYARKSSRCSA